MQNEIQQLIKPLGISSLTPIQEQTLAQYSSGNEFILYAPTGSGKTLAFLLPLIMELKQEQEHVQALIISPTRELALQIEAVFKSLKTEFSISACYGGHSMKTEINNLAAIPDVVVGTPGRIADHLNRKSLFLRKTKNVIIDEFDKCLTLGFHVEIEQIFGNFTGLNKLVFCSATQINEFPSFIQLKSPIYIDCLDSDQAPSIKYNYFNDAAHKLRTLVELIQTVNHEPAIIFCNFRDDVDGVQTYFEDNGFATTPYHGGMEQQERERSLIKFRHNSHPVLICTDLGARGLDIPEVKHIIHYELPDKEDAFIHRNGRTARMSANGNVYFFEDDFNYRPYSMPKSKEHVNSKINNDYIIPNWTTLYFSAGKKNKVNKIDLLGFICQKGGLDKKDVGVISVLDFTSYVAVSSENVDALINELRKHKVKGQKLKIAISM